MDHRVFAYGTLTFSDVAAAVTGGCPRHEPARLTGHARHALNQCLFPGAVPCPGHAIDGVLYHDITAAALERIDRFEGSWFRRQRVTVTVGAEARRCTALVYLLRPRWHTLLLPRDWCPEEFRRVWSGSRPPQS